MSAKKGLFSIGELSKLTGASVRSLRYYETLGILTPAHIDPDSGYRYYSFEQTYLVELILFCIELDIPLKEFASFIDAEKKMNLPALLEKGKTLAYEKMKTVKRGLALIEQIEMQMRQSEQYPKGEIYTRTFPEKFFYVHPLKQSPTQKELIDMVKTLWGSSQASYYKNEQQELAEYGILHEHTKKGIKRFAFIEVAGESFADEIWNIPAGVYHCMQQEGTQIENVRKLFSRQLADKKEFLAIETEIFTAEHNMTVPTSELRVISFT